MHDNPALPRMLLVDDEPLILRAVGRLMSRYFSLRTARSAEEALAALEASAALDLFVFDMQMPIVDGPALFAKVMARWPELRGRAIVATGAPESEAVQAFVVREGIKVIGKPYTVDELLALVTSR